MLKRTSLLWTVAMLALLVSFGSAGAALVVEANFNDNQDLDVAPTGVTTTGTLQGSTTVSGGALNVGSTTPTGVIYSGAKPDDIFDVTPDVSWGTNTMAAIVTPNSGGEAERVIASVGGGTYGLPASGFGIVWYLTADGGTGQTDYCRLGLSNEYAEGSFYLRQPEGFLNADEAYFVMVSWKDHDAASGDDTLQVTMYIRSLSDTDGTSALYRSQSRTNSNAYQTPGGEFDDLNLTLGARQNSSNQSYAADSDLDLFQIYDTFTDTQADCETLYQNVIPEPTTMALLAGGSLLLLRKRHA